VALNIGDTTMTLADATGWANGTDAALRKFTRWPYVNTKGYSYPAYTYSNHVTGANTWPQGGVTGNVITLSVPWAGPALPVGTPVRNSENAGTYRYIALSGFGVPTVWTVYQGFIGGISPPTNDINKFFAGTAYMKILFLVNYTAQQNVIRWNEIMLTTQADLKVTSPDGLTTRRLGIDNTGAVVAVP
jgi:hypothetical protein